MRVAIGSDERTALTDFVAAELEARGHDLISFGPLDARFTTAADPAEAANIARLETIER